MTLDRAVMLFAGGMVVLFVGLSAFASPMFLWFTLFIGVNMMQAAVTGFCPAAMLFKAMGVRPGRVFR